MHNFRFAAPYENVHLTSMAIMMFDPGDEVLATSDSNSRSANSGGVPANNSSSFVVAYS